MRVRFCPFGPRKGGRVAFEVPDFQGGPRAWEWLYYGRPKVAANLYFEEFVESSNGSRPAPMPIGTSQGLRPATGSLQSRSWDGATTLAPSGNPPANGSRRSSIDPAPADQQLP